MSVQKKKRKWIKWVVLALAVLIIGSVWYTSTQTAAKAALIKSESEAAVQAARGDISVIVQANGSIRPASSSDVYAPLSGEVELLSVKNGDAVKAGDLILTLKNDTIDDEIATLKSQLDSTDLQILTTDSSKNSSITSPVAGRVKAIYTAEGQDVGTAMKTNSGLILLSADDMMQLVFAPDIEVKSGDEVTVVVGARSVDATVRSVNAGLAAVVFPDDPDNLFPINADAICELRDGTTVGKGILTVHMPYVITGSEGLVSEILVETGDKVSAGDRLIKLDEPVYSAAYAELLSSRQETLDKLAEKIAKRDALRVYAPMDGIVENLTVTERTSVQENAPLFTVGSSDAFELNVAADELDIAKIKTGQTVSIALDALAGAEYTGVVDRVSSAGVYSNGVTTYDVTIRLDNADGILSGMSARADILVASHTDVLLIPVSAIKTIDGEKYVMAIPAPGTSGAASAAGVQTKITIGLSDATEAEVLSGIEDGQYLLDLSADSTSDGLFTFGRNQG
jgi:HlyD family secretion protein